MGKLTETAAVSAPRSAAQGPTAKVPTSEQIRMAQLLVDPKSEDHSILKDKVRQVMELTRCDENSAFIALHDCDNDLDRAVLTLLESEKVRDEWIVQEGKKAKKGQQQLANAADAGESDGFDNNGGKSTANRRRGTGARGGGPDGQSRFRGRGGSAGTRGTFGKENDSRGDFGSDERSGNARGRGRGAREANDRGGRGFGGRGGRRGGGGFNQNDGGGGGFAQIDSWTSAAPDSNTWDNSMANTTVNNGPAGEWGKRRNKKDSNTWDNSMAHNDYDWGGEEDWSKLRDGMVIESSSVTKSLDKSLPPVAPSSALAQAASPAPAPADVSRVRGETIDVNSLFGPGQATQQQSTSSSNAWTSSKQATADLKNELGIGKIAATQILADAPSHTHDRDSGPPKLSGAKVELPLTRATASTGPIDVQFGDMTLGADSSHGYFDFTSSTGYQQSNTVVPPQPKEQQPQHSAYQRAAGDHPNSLSSTRSADILPKADVNAGSYSGAGSFSNQPSEQQSVPQAVQQKPYQQQQTQPPQHQQQQFSSNRVSHTGAGQVSSGLPQRNVSSGVSGPSAEQRSQLLSNNANTGSASAPDSVGGQSYRDENLHQMNVGSTLPGASKNQVSAGAAVNQTMAPYQQAMTGMYQSYMIDPSLNYLQAQNLLYNSGAYDMRAVNSVGGANLAMGRDTSGDVKAHMMRQENGSIMPSGTAPPAASANSLNMPPPGLPAPTASNAEAAAAVAHMAAAMYPGFPLSVNAYPPSGSPFYSPPFYVPNVSSSSVPASANQYQRTGGYQQTQALFGNAGYEDLQHMVSQPDYGKTNYNVMQQQTQGKAGSSGGGSSMALGGSDVGNKYGAGVKGPYDSKQYGPATATPPPPQLGNMNYTPTGTAPTHYNYGYMQPIVNMMPGPAVPSNAPMTNDLLNQRTVNQNGKPPGGPGGVGKGMNQQYQYGTPWGN